MNEMILCPLLQDLGMLRKYDLIKGPAFPSNQSTFDHDQVRGTFSLGG